MFIGGWEGLNFGRWKGRREETAFCFCFFVIFMLDSVVRVLRGATTRARGGAGGFYLDLVGMFGDSD